MKPRYAICSLAALVLLGSCEFALGPRTEGTITLNLAGPASRAFSDPPFEGLPVFSSVTVTVSGSGMPTASQTVPGTATLVTLQVPAGPTRKVEVYAVPDWDATPQTPKPTLAKAFGGTVVVDVAGGQTVNVAMDMGVVETKIVLPDVNNDGYVGVSNVLPVVDENDYLSSLSERSDFDFDRFGRLYYSSGSSIQRIDTILANSFQVLSSINFNSIYGISIDRRNSRLYWVEKSEGTEFYFADLMQEIPIPIQIFGDDFNFIGSSVAVDPEGFIYIGVYRFTTEQEGIAKISVDYDGEVTSIRLIAFTEFEALGTLSYEDFYLQINDMVVHEGRLFIAASENYFQSLTHHGKVIEVRLADLSKNKELGWSYTTPISNPSSKFYGPKRFLAIKPRKLIFADEGAIEINPGLWEEIDRAIELDIESGGFIAYSFRPPSIPVIGFFSAYTC